MSTGYAIIYSLNGDNDKVTNLMVGPVDQEQADSIMYELFGHPALRDVKSCSYPEGLEWAEENHATQIHKAIG
jgi:hypothetical protein